MFLHEHGLEVSWIYAGVIASPLFRIDIPLSSKSIGFGTKTSGTETDDEVELAEEFGHRTCRWVSNLMVEKYSRLLWSVTMSTGVRNALR